jgi:hypothetical protein
MARWHQRLLLSVAGGMLTMQLAGQQLPFASLQAAGGGVPRNTPFADTARLHRLLIGLSDDATVRVRIADGPRLIGRYRGPVGDAFVLRTGGAEERMRQTLIDSLWTRERPIVSTAVRSGALVALVRAAIALGRTFRVACRPGALGQAPFPDCRATAGNVGHAAAVGGLMGTALGAAIGAAFPTWKLRFP